MPNPDLPPPTDGDGENAKKASREPDTLPGSSGRPSAAPPALLGRYCVGDEIARGGMGVIYAAEDVLLEREVALKVLLEEHQAKIDLRWRFLDEARINARLQHPGIIPIYDLGQLPDARPFFAMRLIRGTSLAALLAARSDPSENRPALLKAFEQNKDIHTAVAAQVFGVKEKDVTKDQRQAYGKVPELALGYQGGVGAFQTMAKTYLVKVSDDQAKEIRDAWRADHPAIVRLWEALEMAADDGLALGLRPLRKAECEIPARDVTAFLREREQQPARRPADRRQAPQRQQMQQPQPAQRDARGDLAGLHGVVPSGAATPAGTL